LPLARLRCEVNRPGMSGDSDEPGLSGVGLLEFGHATSVEGAVSVPKRYPEEFRRKVLDLVAAGRPIAQISTDLGLSDQTIYNWRKQELVDRGQLPGLNRAEQAELTAAYKRIRELETEVAILKMARQLLREPHDPKGGTRP
jgi:transposase-like protein